MEGHSELQTNEEETAEMVVAAFQKRIDEPKPKKQEPSGIESALEVSLTKKMEKMLNQKLRDVRPEQGGRGSGSPSGSREDVSTIFGGKTGTEVVGLLMAMNSSLGNLKAQNQELQEQVQSLHHQVQSMQNEHWR